MSDLSSETRALIASLRDVDRPTDADRTRNRGELASRLGIGVVAAGGAIAAAKTATASTAVSIGAAGGTKVGLGGLGGLSLTMKIAGAAVVASGVAVSTAAVIHETQKPEPVVVASASPSVARVAPPKRRPSTGGAAVEAKAAAEADEAPVLETLDEASVPVVPEAAFEAPARAAPEKILASPMPPIAVRPPAPAVLTVEGPSREAREASKKDIASKAAAEPRPSETAPPEMPPPARSETTPAPESVPSAETTLAVETSLLRRAQSALVSGEAVRALALLDEHALKFPHGVLTEERDAARVTAICASGQVERARAEASRFVAAHPSSTMTARVRRTCEAR